MNWLDSLVYYESATENANIQNRLERISIENEAVSSKVVQIHFIFQGKPKILKMGN